MDYKFRGKMKDGTEKFVHLQEQVPIPSHKIDVPIDIDGKTIIVRIQQTWSNGDVLAFEIDPE